MRIIAVNEKEKNMANERWEVRKAVSEKKNESESKEEYDSIAKIDDDDFEGIIDQERERVSERLIERL